METTVKVVLGCAAYAVFWLLAVFPAQPLLPIGRTAGSLLSATLMVIFQVVSPDEAYAAIDLPILGLLFGTMLVGAYLQRADMFKHLAQLLQWRSHGGRDLLCRVCAVAAFSSALFTNDTCCVLLTDFVLDMARRNNLPPEPFLLALASSANIGSAATPIGNPQNLIIAIQSGISFKYFLSGILPAMLLGLCINTALLLCFFWRQLSSHSGKNSSMISEPLVLLNPSESPAPPVLWKTSVYAVTAGMLAALLLGLNMSWSAMAAAVALMVVDFRDAGSCLDKVSYSLLVFFSGMFVSVDGFNRTGIPGALWDSIAPFARLDTAQGMLLLSVTILLLSNVASNVPTGESSDPWPVELSCCSY